MSAVGDKSSASHESDTRSHNGIPSLALTAHFSRRVLNSSHADNPARGMKAVFKSLTKRGRVNLELSESKKMFFSQLKELSDHTKNHHLQNELKIIGRIGKASVALDLESQEKLHADAAISLIGRHLEQHKSDNPQQELPNVSHSIAHYRAAFYRGRIREAEKHKQHTNHLENDQTILEQLSTSHTHNEPEPDELFPTDTMDMTNLRDAMQEFHLGIEQASGTHEQLHTDFAQFSDMTMTIGDGPSVHAYEYAAEDLAQWPPATPQFTALARIQDPSSERDQTMQENLRGVLERDHDALAAQGSRTETAFERGQRDHLDHLFRMMERDARW